MIVLAHAPDRIEDDVGRCHAVGRQPPGGTEQEQPGISITEGPAQLPEGDAALLGPGAGNDGPGLPACGLRDFRHHLFEIVPNMNKLHGLAAFGIITGPAAADPVVDQLARQRLLILERRDDIEALDTIGPGGPGHVV